MARIPALVVFTFLVISASNSWAQDSGAGENTRVGLAGRGEEGILTIYPMMTQTGIAANRVFRDDNGRVAKTIYYRGNGQTNPVREAELEPLHVVIPLYDEMGRVRREEFRNPGMELLGYWDISYSEDGDVRVQRTTDGRRIQELRRTGGSEKSHLYFDHTGERLVGIKGKIPVDLAYEWGEVTGGLACGIGVSRSTGLLNDVYVTVTIRNTTGEAPQVVTLWPYRVLEVELRDDQGNLVPIDRSKLSEEDERMRRLNPSATENRQTLAPYEAATYESFKLDDWYSDLPSGAYRLTVRRRAGGRDFELVSNPLALEILR